MSLTYELARLKDLSNIVRIYNQNIASHKVTADLEPVSIEEREPWFLAHSIESSRPIWMIYSQEELMGWVSLSDFNARPAYNKTVEISIYLDQMYKGRGAGSQVLTFIEEQVVNLDVETIVALIFSHNEASQKLFAKFNYQLWGHLPGMAELNGKKRDLDYLGKHLKNSIREV